MAIKIDKKTRTLSVNGNDIQPCALAFMYEYEDCAAISLPSLRRAIARLEGKEIPPFQLMARVSEREMLSRGNADALLAGVTNNVTFCTPPNVMPEFIAVDVNDGGDLITSFFIPCDVDDPSEMKKLISPHVEFRDAALIGYKYWDDPGPKMPPGWDVDILLPAKRMLLSDVYSLATVLVEAASQSGRTMGPEVAQDLCHGGSPEALIGLEESEWLEVKSQGYDLDAIENKIELAQDVSRFANCEEGGILVLGYRTKKNRNGEVISKCTPIREEVAQVARYRSTIDARVFPPIDGLKVQASRQGGGWVLTILVPPQSEENKPFLVHGAIAGGRAEGAFISVVRRRGEASIPITGPAIHSMLAAGRALLRGQADQK